MCPRPRTRFGRVRRLVRALCWRVALLFYGPPTDTAARQHARDVANGETAP